MKPRGKWVMCREEDTVGKQAEKAAEYTSGE